MELDDANSSLVHRKIRLLEFELKVLYGKVSRNFGADAIASFHIWVYLNFVPGLKLSFLTVR